MESLDVSKFSKQDWKLARKVKPIRAKAMAEVFADLDAARFFLLNTLEGNEPIDVNAILCIGEAGDVWQQSAVRLLAKYNVEGIDEDGFCICTPKSENSIECIELGMTDLKINLGLESRMFIYSKWGEAKDGKFIQRFKFGDFLCRQVDDHSDMWIVDRTLFLNTYVMLN